jgi:putative DNA primase/helicase
MVEDVIIPFRPTGKKATPETLKLKISRGRYDLGHVTKASYKWFDLAALLTVTMRDPDYTMASFRALSEVKQGEVKQQAPFIVGGTFKGTHRAIRDLVDRTLIMLDIDECSPATLSDIMQPNLFSPLFELEYVAYTTRSHTPENPRVRIILPLDCPTNPQDCVDATRWLAHRMDPRMRTVDVVSFRAAQLMYRPATNSDGEFLSHHNRGVLVSAADIFADYGWTGDLEKLPRSPIEKGALRPVGEKLPDPRTKRGHIGAFCRAYSVVDGMLKFLSDVYEPVGDDRLLFKFIPGTGNPGVRVYDDEQYVYSNHGTDPAGLASRHIFDLVRVVRFGHLDTFDPDDGVVREVTALASYRAMLKFVEDDPNAAAELRKEALDQEAMANDSFDDTTEDEAISQTAIITQRKRSEITSATPYDPKWQERLNCTTQGDPKYTLHNVILILENDRRFRFTFAYNEFSEAIVRTRPMNSKTAGINTGEVRDTENGDLLNDEDMAMYQAVLSMKRGKGFAGYGLEVSDHIMAKAMGVVGKKIKFHPIRRYLRSLTWDGNKRIEKLLPQYFGARNTALNRDIGRKVMLGAVARAMEPGHKFDFCAVFRSFQGVLKSTAIAALCGERWFIELKADFHDPKGFVEAVAGRWFVEIPELAQFTKNEVEVIKSMLSSMGEQHREAYGRKGKFFPRQCIMLGSTNRDQFLRDDENRRIWVVMVGGVDGRTAINVEAIRRDRDQLWAEAFDDYLTLRFDHDESRSPWLYLDIEPGNKAAAASIAADHRIDDGSQADAAVITAWLDRPVSKAAAEPGFRLTLDAMPDDDDAETTYRRKAIYRDIAYSVFGVTSERDYDQRMQNRIRSAMRHIPDWTMQPKPIRVRGLGFISKWTLRTGTMPNVL